MGLVGAQKVLAQAFGVRQPVFGKVADDGEQFRRQAGQPSGPGAGRGQFASDGGIGLAILVQLDEALPAIDEGTVRRHGRFKRRPRRIEVAPGDVVVAHLLMRPAEARPTFEQLGEGLKRRLPFVAVPQRHREGIPRFHVAWLRLEQGGHRTFRLRRLPRRKLPLRRRDGGL